MTTTGALPVKPLVWMGGSKKDLVALPALAMLASSRLLNPPQAALIERKSKSGIATPKPDMELIEARLKRAAEIAEEMKSELKKS
jgi:phage-related protein